MALKRKKWLAGDFEVRAFADIVFLLLIFFILTTTFVQPQGNRLRIPSGVQDPSAKMARQPTISLSPTGIRWGERGQELSLAELRATLLQANFSARPEGQRVVILNTAPDVPFQMYFEVVMAIHNADGVLALVEPPAGGPETGGSP